MPMANTKWVDSRTVDGRISNNFTISSPPPCQNQQNHHHCQCSIFHPPHPPKYPIQNLHLRCGVENDLSKGSPSSKFTGSSTSSLRSKLANANNTSVQTRIIRMHIPHLFLIGKYYFLRVPTGLFRTLMSNTSFIPWCQTHQDTCWTCVWHTFCFSNSTLVSQTMSSGNTSHILFNREKSLFKSPHGYFSHLGVRHVYSTCLTRLILGNMFGTCPVLGHLSNMRPSVSHVRYKGYTLRDMYYYSVIILPIKREQ